MATGGRQRYGGTCSGERLNRVAFPMGGMGAGMICLEGTGALSHVSIRNKPAIFCEPNWFAAVSIKGQPNLARVVEGPVPGWKIFGQPGTGNGAGDKSYGLPRFREASFDARFPFGTVHLSDPTMPVTVAITGWSPFEPGDPDSASLPVAGLEYTFTNTSDSTKEAAFSFHSSNFLMVQGSEKHGVRRAAAGKGFTLFQQATDEQPWQQAAFSATVANDGARANCAWFRGGWFDSRTIAWKDVVNGACYDRDPVRDGDPAPGGSVFVPFTLAPGTSTTIVLRLSWHVPQSNVRCGDAPDPTRKETCCADKPRYVPWYVGRFEDVDDVAEYWADNYDSLRAATKRFSDCFYDTTLPPEVIEAVAANLTILKSPTVMRQEDGRLWCWEGCTDDAGCCHGSCTHVWNYAQAIPHLFPSLERTLRETEFEQCQDDRGHQAFRVALPIRRTTDAFHAAADGQLGGIMKIYRDWRISGDTEWLRRLWPKVRASLDYCIEAWDPRHRGLVEEPHHNTYDIEFWGPDAMCSSFYLGALRAAILMAEELGDDPGIYPELYETGVANCQSELYNGEYFYQQIKWEGLRSKPPHEALTLSGKYSPEALALLHEEGPKYQYGTGCLSDGVLGSWLAMVAGVGQVLDAEKVTSHLLAVHRHNLKHDLFEHANPQRPTFACGAEGGLLLCTWPRGGELSLPFVYSDEVWTGIEYQVASHLMLMRQVEKGLEIVRTCRDRYDGRVRNPFNEYECGHWYARAMASYGLLQGMTGARYDAVERVLHITPRIKGDWRSFLSTATGYGTVGIKDGKPFLEVVHGNINVQDVRYEPA